MSDEKTGRAGMNWPGEQWREFVAATRFLTILPLPGSARLFRTEVVGTHLIVGAAYFPLVGLLLALVLSVLPALLGSLLPPLLLAALLVVGQVLLTGGLHLDGLMDACDGLFSGRERERVLEIMRDSRVGSFGVLGAGCVLLLRFALFASFNVRLLPLALLIVLPIARWAMLLAVSCFPCARPTGLAPAFRETVTRLRLLIAGLTACIIAVSLGGLSGLCALAGVVLTALLIGYWVTRRLGGLTGDIYGGIEEVAELVALLLLLLVTLPH